MTPVQPIVSATALTDAQVSRMSAQHQAEAFTEWSQPDDLVTERDQALAASRWETDLCAQAIADLKLMTLERDILKAELAALRAQSLVARQPDHHNRADGHASRECHDVT